jgi:hypothetical protein
MSKFQQFCDLPEEKRVGAFEELFRAALESLLPDLAASPWYVREREVVNLFVLGHLIPQFQNENLDITQLGIEVPVLKLPESSKAKRGKYADIVVWPHTKATIWQTCKPLIQIEWKNISCREKNPRGLDQQHEKDIRYLNHNRKSVCMSYAVLTDQRDGHVELRCKRILDGKEPEDFFSSPLRCAATCPEEAIAALQYAYPKLLLRPQACPDCFPHGAARI